jgi:hypothetical protein
LFFAAILFKLNAEPSDRPVPYRPYSAELQNINPELLNGLNEKQYKQMSLGDPLLKLAYSRVFTRAIGDFSSLMPDDEMILSDMRSRGDSLSPLLLKLAEDNQETGYEVALLCLIDQLGSVVLEPYLQYARNLLANRTQTMSAATASAASAILAKHGSESDLKILEQVFEKRPYVRDDLSKSIKTLREQIESRKPPNTPFQKNPSLEGSNAKIALESRDIPALQDEDKSIRRNTIALTLCVGAGLLLLIIFMKNKDKNEQKK